MKKTLFNIFLLAGWILLFTFLISGYFVNKFKDTPESSFISSLYVGDHVQMFKGALQCSLTSEDLLERKQHLKEKIFSKVTKKEESHNGYIYYFDDEPDLLNNALEFIQKEKACCPFFKFDVSILPFQKGFAVQISGSEEAFEFLKDFEENEF